MESITFRVIPGKAWLAKTRLVQESKQKLDCSHVLLSQRYINAISLKGLYIKESYNILD